MAPAHPPIAGKVAGLVTRPGAGGPELLVFEHPRSGVQVPAGTLHPGEDPEAGALRETWEETGVDDVEVAGLAASIPAHHRDGWETVVRPALADGVRVIPGYSVPVLDRRGDEVLVDFEGARVWVPSDTVSLDVTRYLFHFRVRRQTPDEWWVHTPDGAGLCWRCHWIPLDGDEGVVPFHQAWIDSARPALLAAGEDRSLMPAPAADAPAGAIHTFWAPPWGGKHFVTWWAGDDPDGAPVRQAQALCLTADDEAVMVTTDRATGWTLPGGRLEAGEDVETALVREVREEACATVVAHRLVGYQRAYELGTDGVVDDFAQAKFVARVDLDPWEPRHETCERSLLDLDGLSSRLSASWSPVGRHWVQRAVSRRDEVR